MRNARLMTKSEIADFFNRIRNLKSSKELKAHEFFEQNKSKIIDEYKKHLESKIDENNIEKEKLEHEKNMFEKKVCVKCGSMMRLINGSFWGCPNFRDVDNGVKHSTYSANKDEYYYMYENKVEYLYGLKIKTTWASDIIKSVEGKGIITPLLLVRLLEDEGYRDMREYSNRSSSKHALSGWVTANENSKISEKEVLEYFKSVFDTCVYQVGIKYNFANDREKIGFIDLIASDELDVFIIEVKNNSCDVKENQLENYHKAIKHIMNKSKDKRNVYSIHVVYGFMGNDKNDNIISFDKINTIKEINKLKIILGKPAYKKRNRTFSILNQSVSIADFEF